MRANILALALVALAGCAPPAAAPSPVQIAADVTGKSVALVRVNRDGEFAPYCSGTWVAREYILTAAHCVDDREPGDLLQVALRGDLGPAFEARVVPRFALLDAVDADHDLALVYMPGAPTHATARVRAAQAVPGEAAYACGHSLGLWFSFSAGNVAAVREADVGLPIAWVQATTPISPGNSGGGLFDASGQLLGVVSRHATRGDNLGFSVAGRYVTPFLAAHGVR